MKILSIPKRSIVPSAVMESEIDIDVKPMMNVLLILIPFLVSVAVYTRLSVLDMSLPPDVTGIAATQGVKPRLKLTVVITPSSLAVTYGESLLDSIGKTSDASLIGGRSAFQGPEYAYEDLLRRLQLRRETVEAKDEVIVAPRDGIAFKYVVKVMDMCKKAGFEKVSLASAPEDPGHG